MQMPQKLHNIVLEVAYDGTRLYGWQKAPPHPSVEEELEKALTLILQHEVQLQAASRTDRGVHAHGQVVNFFTPLTLDFKLLQYRLFQLLPEDIAIVSIQEKELSFHPTLDSIGKEYHYHLANTPILLPKLRFTHWHIKYPLNREAMRQALHFFEGTHDFKTLCNFRKGLSYTSTERTLFRCELIEESEPGLLRIEIHGRDFMYKMVRNIVGTCVYVGLGKIQIEELPAIMEAKSRAGAGMTAPAHGLLLHRVFY